MCMIEQKKSNKIQNYCAFMPPMTYPWILLILTAVKINVLGLSMFYFDVVCTKNKLFYFSQLNMIAYKHFIHYFQPASRKLKASP